MKKYEFTGEVRYISRKILHRIRALIDIPEHDVKAGDLGGWLETEENLSHNGAAWVTGSACVTDSALVTDAACLTGAARVTGKRHNHFLPWQRWGDICLLRMLQRLD
nr:MAG TPA: putative transferase, nesg, ydcK, Structural Genomics.38A [Caudoviricetes sp.]